MLESTARRPMLDADICDRALESRDARFDGVFFVGIRTTMIYCRPVCPARVSYKDRRRFFETAAAAERDGFRPCLRCRPELAPGRALCDAVPRVARAAAMRIAAGALNGSGVGDLASELGVGERQLRRAMERELGVSPVELAQTHRLLLAKCLLTDTALPVTRIAYASGFQSLRRFNAAFREHYRMSPSLLRKHPRPPAPADEAESPEGDFVRLTLAYRAPLAWEPLLGALSAGAQAGIELVTTRRYARTVQLDGCRGIVLIEDAAGARSRSARGRVPAAHLTVDLSVSLLPALMPLLARLRHLLDLDAEPAVIGAHLAGGGLAAAVAQRPGLRVPGAFDGFEVAVREIAGECSSRVVDALGEPIETGIAELARLAPTPERVAGAGVDGITSLGIAAQQSEALVAVARAVAGRTLRLEPGADPEETLRALAGIGGLDGRAAAAIVMRATHWPDAFPEADAELLRTAEQWRPWRAYAAAYLG